MKLQNVDQRLSGVKCFEQLLVLREGAFVEAHDLQPLYVGG